MHYKIYKMRMFIHKTVCFIAGHKWVKMQGNKKHEVDYYMCTNCFAYRKGFKNVKNR
jgi:hypothetical protein